MGAALSHTTLIIVVVCAVLAAVLLVLLALKLLLRATNRRPAAPLPPIQPLAHHRLLKYDSLDSRPPSGVADSPENIPPFPNHSFQSLDSSFPPPSPVSSVFRAPPPRPISSASLSSVGHTSRRISRPNLRGLPHGPTSQVQIILPAPLSATLPRPSSFRRDTDIDRMSTVDKWISVGRDDSTIPFSTMPKSIRSSRRASASAIMTSSSSFTYFQHPFPPPPVPQIPKEMISHV